MLPPATGSGLRAVDALEDELDPDGRSLLKAHDCV